MTVKQLTTLYHRNKIKLRSTNTTWKVKQETKEAMPEEHLNFAKSLNWYMKRGYPIFYMDESSFHSQDKGTKKIWQKKNQRIAKEIPSKPHHITVYGAMSEWLRKPVFLLADTTNIENFSQFLSVMDKILPKNLSQKPILVLDKHSSHTSDQITEELNRLFRPLFTPNLGWKVSKNNKKSNPNNCESLFKFDVKYICLNKLNKNKYSHG